MGQNKFTAEDLKQYQALPLDIKVRMTYLRIRWWLNEFDGYVSFSGGKDSTVLLHIARQVSSDIPAVFVDTGLEYPEVREFALSQDNVVRLKPEMNFRKVIETYGYPIISKEVAQKIYEYRKNPNGYTKARFDDNSEHIKKYGKRYSMSKWTWLRDSNIPISHMCCNVMKKKPVKNTKKKLDEHLLSQRWLVKAKIGKQHG